MIKITYGMAGAFLGAFVGGIIVMAVVVLVDDIMEYRKELRRTRERLQEREAQEARLDDALERELEKIMPGLSKQGTRVETDNPTVYAGGKVYELDSGTGTMHEYHPDYCDGNIGTKREESQNEKEPGKERTQKTRA